MEQGQKYDDVWKEGVKQEYQRLLDAEAARDPRLSKYLEQATGVYDEAVSKIPTGDLTFGDISVGGVGTSHGSDLKGRKRVGSRALNDVFYGKRQAVSQFQDLIKRANENYWSTHTPTTTTDKKPKMASDFITASFDSCGT